MNFYYMFFILLVMDTNIFSAEAFYDWQENQQQIPTPPSNVFNNLIDAATFVEQGPLPLLIQDIGKKNIALRGLCATLQKHNERKVQLDSFLKQFGKKESIIVAIADPANQGMASKFKMRLMKKHFGLEGKPAEELLRNYRMVHDFDETKVGGEISTLQREIAGLEAKKQQIEQQKARSGQQFLAPYFLPQQQPVPFQQFSNYNFQQQQQAPTSQYSASESLPAVDNSKQKYPKLACHMYTWHAHGQDPSNLKRCLCSYQIYRGGDLKLHIDQIKKWRDEAMHGIKCPHCEKRFGSSGAHTLHIRRMHNPQYGKRPNS